MCNSDDKNYRPAPRGALRAILSVILIVIAIAATCCSGEYGPDQCGGDKGTEVKNFFLVKSKTVQSR